MPWWLPGGLIATGMWIFSDAVYSYTLYLNAASYENGRRQDFRHDHWVRLLRGVCGGLLIWWGFILY